MTGLWILLISTEPAVGSRSLDLKKHLSLLLLPFYLHKKILIYAGCRNKCGNSFYCLKKCLIGYRILCPMGYDVHVSLIGDTKLITDVQECSVLI